MLKPTRIPSTCRQYLGILALITLIFLACYLPGLSSPFLLDDYANLYKLGEYNGVRNLETFGYYIFGGIAGPTGRPIALLSFLIDGTNWPTDPIPFKRTNIILHYCSGFLLFLVIRNIYLTQSQNSQRVFWASVIAASIWVFHPFLVSTVLYAVQRMAILAAFFAILGLYGYTYGRLQIQHRPIFGYRCMTVSIVLCTLLAVLSKENGALLPLFIYLIEKIIFQRAKIEIGKINKTWFFIFVTLPSLIILTYLLYKFYGYCVSTGYTSRPFTLSQRLLTETRIVTGYLYNFFVPQMYYDGLFKENYPISTSLFKPISTLATTGIIIALPLTAFVLRKKQPLLCLAILFFYAGHLMESTFIPLELYFEHRNYLPAFLLFLPLGQCFLAQDQAVIKISICLFLCICIFFTYQRSTLWGNPTTLSLFWAQQNPDSHRAQRTAAITLDKNGDRTAALHLLTTARNNMAEDLGLELHWMILKCQTATLSETDFQSINNKLKVLQYTARNFIILDTAITIATKENCKGLDYKKVLTLLDSLINNPFVKNHRHIYHIHHFKGQIHAQHHPGEAAAEFSLALSLSNNVEHGLAQTAILATNKHFPEALAHLQMTEEIYQKKQKKGTQKLYKNYGREIVNLRNAIQKNLQQ